MSALALLDDGHCKLTDVNVAKLILGIIPARIVLKVYLVHQHTAYKLYDIVGTLSCEGIQGRPEISIATELSGDICGWDT